MTILSIRCYREPSFVRISETKSTNSASEHVESVRLSAKAILKQMSVLYQQNVIVSSFKSAECSVKTNGVVSLIEPISLGDSLKICQ